MKRVLVICLAVLFLLPPVLAQEEAAVVEPAKRVETATYNPLENLTADQRMELERMKLSVNEKTEALLAMENIVIPIVGIVVPFGIALCIVFVALYYRSEERKAKFALMEKALESGREIPLDFFAEPVKKRETSLQGALTAVGAGVGMILMFLFWSGMQHYAMIGAIPCLIGVGKLIAWKLEHPKRDDADVI